MKAGGSVREQILKAMGHLGILLGAVFAVTVLLAAAPGHHSPTVEAVGLQGAQNPPAQEMPGMDHGKMGTPSAEEKAEESAAMSEMAHMHGGSPHLHMTEMRAPQPGDAERANQIVAQLKVAMEKYKDYHVALNEGFRIFLPNVPQPEYHFTNFSNAFEAAFVFDPAKPTSLLYRKTPDGGYELVGAMYTMPKRATEEQLNARVPLSVAMWHLHTNLCMPPKEQTKTADYTKFGLKGSISTQQACDAAGGTFHPTVFGWMVHVYPYETSPEAIFAMHHHD